MIERPSSFAAFIDRAHFALLGSPPNLHLALNPNFNLNLNRVPVLRIRIKIRIRIEKPPPKKVDGALMDRRGKEKGSRGCISLFWVLLCRGLDFSG